MKFIDEFRNPGLCDSLITRIHREADRNITVMEVCGGHTLALHRFGIAALLPPTIELLSGPGCPVCVTSRGYIDNAVALALSSGIVVCTYGDLIRVPGSALTLEQARAEGARVKVVHSPMQCIELANKDPGYQYVFLGIGFETTAPASAVAIKTASAMKMDNFCVYSAHKLMPPAMAAIINAGVRVDAYICPGHVSTITGSAMFYPLVEKYKVACVISGFEPLDLLLSILMIVRQIKEKKPSVEIQYTRAVKPHGNQKAQQLIQEVFNPCDAWWRGLGILPKSGLTPRNAKFDAEAKFSLSTGEPADPPGCRCGDVLKGIVKPVDCKLFSTICNPVHPVGACMVSSEGACQSYYRYANS